MYRPPQSTPSADIVGCLPREFWCALGRDISQGRGTGAMLGDMLLSDSHIS